MKSLRPLLSLVLVYALVALAEPPFDLHQFKTEPTLRIPKITILNVTQDRSLLSQGFVFLDSLFANEPIVGGGTGPMIFDMDGHLVWGGLNAVAKDAYRTQHTHICDYHGALGSHLCTTETYFYNVTRPNGSRRVDQYGAHKIFNQQYEQVSSNLTTAAGFSTPQKPDQHEFIMVDNGNAFLQVIYHVTRADLRPIGGQPDQEIVESCFQEVDLVTGKITFHWCGLSNLELSDSSQSNAGWVLERLPDAEPWDWMHLNSVDKNEEGDYLLSIRYFSQVIKVAGANAMKIHGVSPGTILWRLGGSAGNIETSHDLSFAWQHDARFYSTTKNETIITIFDNFKDIEFNERACSGKMVKINNVTMKAELLREWRHPDGVLCDSMGSLRILPNGNAFLGWGNQALFSEFSATGDLLFHATFAARGSSPLATYNYRSLKSTWHSTPRSKPKLLAYSKTCSHRDSPLVVYSSWNGATEVAMWRYYVSLLGKNGPWISAGTFAKDGFETKAILLPRLPSILSSHAKYVYVEALDINFKVLSSAISGLYIPGPNGTDISPKCDHYGCFAPVNYDYTTEDNFATSCGGTPLWPLVWVLFGCLTFIAFGARKILRLARQHRGWRAACTIKERAIEGYMDEPLIVSESA